MSGTYRQSPFPFVNADTVEIAPMRFVNVLPVAGTLTLATDGLESLGVTVGTTTVPVGEPISAFSLKEINRTFLVKAGGTIAAGDEVGADANGLAITDAVNGVAFAQHAAVVGQHLTIIPKGSF